MLKLNSFIINRGRLSICSESNQYDFTEIDTEEGMQGKHFSICTETGVLEDQVKGFFLSFHFEQTAITVRLGRPS